MDKKIINLWLEYNQAANNIKNIFATSNIVGEFAERLVTEYYNGKQLIASSKSADIICQDGIKIQVKARIIKRINSVPLGIIRSWNFDYLVIVLFSTQGFVEKAFKTTVEHAKELAIFDKYQNGYVITVNNSFLSNSNIYDITEDLNKIYKNNDNKPSSIINKISYNQDIYPELDLFGEKINTKKNSNESFQDFVKRILKLFFDKELLSAEELTSLQSKDYSKKTFGLEMPFLTNDKTKLRDNSDKPVARYWIKTPFPNGFYACSQWWKGKIDIYEPKFAKWIQHVILSYKEKNNYMA